MSEKPQNLSKKEAETMLRRIFEVAKILADEATDQQRIDAQPNTDLAYYAYNMPQENQEIC